MRSTLLLLLIFTFASASNILGQSIIGKWKTIDDKTGITKSYVSISEKDGKFYGHVTEILDEETKGTNPICELCKGDKKNQPIEGLEIFWNMEHDKGNKWEGGKILDPENGKVYGCKLELESADKLKVRGFLGFAALGRNQFWYRAE
jgi:uncharacterized protein (DUF2147 family)